jgi:hypothetical protein
LFDDINDWFLFQRRLYEYALNAVCSPLRVIEPGITSDQLAAHVAKVYLTETNKQKDFISHA